MSNIDVSSALMPYERPRLYRLASPSALGLVKDASDGEATVRDDQGRPLRGKYPSQTLPTAPTVS